ncbi:MAG: 50S ribosomal protein L4 [Bdellovibrionaceae bacterium]|nr:50S ribosomal protein L4 [Pseudobdellovibrionaceae bacterium]
MATVDVLDWNNKKVGSAELTASVFEAPVRKDILHTVVRWQLAKRRQGTHCTKTRAEVNGTSKKPYKQKGTGNARRGTQKSPLIAGGGVTFGPKPRDYEYDLPKKVKQLGLRSALSYLFAEGRLKVVENMTLEQGKTKEACKALKNLSAEKSVLITDKREEMFDRATKNLTTCRYYTVEGLNVYDLLKFNTAIITKDSLAAIDKRCGVESK